MLHITCDELQLVGNIIVSTRLMYNLAGYRVLSFIVQWFQIREREIERGWRHKCLSEREREKETLTDIVTAYREVDLLGCSTRITGVERAQLVKYMPLWLPVSIMAARTHSWKERFIAIAPSFVCKRSDVVNKHKRTHKHTQCIVKLVSV